jgi:hypothetical protein
MPPFPSSETEPVEAAVIREQLERILESPQFKNSRRCSAFLRLVVEATAEGRTDSIKERTLGVAIFERAPNYDTNQDPIVRNTAGQVRKRLAQYYFSAGHEAEVRIDLPPGSYVPEISAPPPSAAAIETQEPVIVPDTALPEASRRREGWRTRALVGAVVVTAVITVVAASLLRPPKTAIDHFWAPTLKAPGPVMLIVGQGHTYKLNPEWDGYFEGQAGERPREAPPDAAVPIETVVPVWDRHIGVTDAQAVIRLGALFTRMEKEVTLRGGRNTSLGDLRRRPVVLVGAFNNEWTLRLTGELRFYFDMEDGQYFVRDRLRPENHAWRVEVDSQNPQIQTDYAIVSRVHNPTTEQAVVVAGGIRGGGTYAAGEFLTNPSYMTAAFKNAPRGWEMKNAQFVLSTKLYSGTPGPPQVVAAHYW